MEIFAENGVRLGEMQTEISNNEKYLYFIPRGNMTTYMLEQALKQMRKLE